jgi:two-component system, chemotaxis family, protein-glutamate methylesterase/glutaminase
VKRNQNSADHRIKVLVVDDSAFFRQTFSDMLKTSSGIKVVGTAADGTEAIRFLSAEEVDVITLDLEMSRMDGFTFLRWLMTNHPLPVVVVSSRSESNNVFKALELGAVDFLPKPTKRASLEVMKIQQELLEKVELAATIPHTKIRPRLSEEIRLIKKTRTRMPAEEKPSPLTSRPETGESEVTEPVKIVTIGASTGGPPAIQTIVSQLPQDLSVAVAIAQHMPGGFTEYFAKRLDHLSQLKVKEASHEEAVEPGKVYIAPGGYHVTFEREKGVVRFSIKPRSEGDKYSPSVDILMKSAAEIYGRRTLGIILTGMGRDGKQGMRCIKENGGSTLAESEETAVVFGMPREAIEEGVVDKVLTLQNIPGEILKRC